MSSAAKLVSSPVSITVNIETSQGIDRDFVEGEMIDTIIESLKRRSNDGEAIIYEGGIRS